MSKVIDTKGKQLDLPFRFLYDGKQASFAGFTSDEPSMTKQSFKDECDINNILRRYEDTGVLPDFSNKAARAQFTDVSGIVDFQSAQNFVIAARDMFMDLPVRLRDKFNNDPAKFLEFVQDPANESTLVEFGLAKARVTEEDTKLSSKEIVDGSKKTKVKGDGQT